MLLKYLKNCITATNMLSTLKNKLLIWWGKSIWDAEVALSVWLAPKPNPVIYRYHVKDLNIHHETSFLVSVPFALENSQLLKSYRRYLESTTVTTQTRVAQRSSLYCWILQGVTRFLLHQQKMDELLLIILLATLHMFSSVLTFYS